MTDEEVQKLYEELEQEFGEELPNFQHHPTQFLYYVKLYRFKKDLERFKK